jgi:Domain of unknown function (DUF4388)
MTKLGYTETNQLMIVIDAIQLGRKTGTLIVVRGEKERGEVGTIVFISGQLLRATTNSFDGPEAFALLTSWQTCQFLFQPSMMPGSPFPDSSTNIASISTPQQSKQERPIPDKVSSPLLKVPYRIREIKEALLTIEAKKFSRTHRHLLLLIDGQRTTKDLIMVMGRPQQEIIILLAQLELAGLIRQ